MSSERATREDAVAGLRSSSGANIVVADDVEGRAVSIEVVGRLEMVVIWAFGCIISDHIIEIN